MIGKVNWIRTFSGLLLVLSFGTYQLVAQEIRLTGDLDGSGAVDFVDFLLFASNFGKNA